MDTITPPRVALSRLIASGGGIGYSPVASGTAASLAALLLGAAMVSVSPWLIAIAAALATIGGLVALQHVRVQGDPAWVVIDEFAGQWLALTALPGSSPLWLVAAFVLFRLLDIFKPGPVGWADRQHGALGIMMDDVIAGALVAILLWLVGGGLSLAGI